MNKIENYSIEHTHLHINMDIYNELPFDIQNIIYYKYIEITKDRLGWNKVHMELLNDVPILQSTYYSHISLDIDYEYADRLPELINDYIYDFTYTYFYNYDYHYNYDNHNVISVN